MGDGGTTSWPGGIDQQNACMRPTNQPLIDSNLTEVFQ